MAVDRNMTVDLSGVEDAVEWLKARKNFFVGLIVVGALAISAVYFVRHQLRQSAVRPWIPLFGAAREPWEMESSDLATLASSSTAEPEVAAYANWWLSLRRFEENDRPGAIAMLDQFRDQNSSHVLCRPFTSATHARDAGASQSICDRAKADIARLSEWKAAHPTPTANPPSNRKQTVTLTTDRGAVVLSLYTDVAPRSCDAFKKVAASFKEQFIAKASPERWIEIGQAESGAALETKEFSEGFPPFEVNRLSHLAGAVTFRQAPFTKGPFNPDLRIYLAPSFSEDDRSTVFAEVTEGLPILEALAKEELKADAPQVLSRPLKITEVKVSESP
jgi:cyclophilin family peptidyl-prolyl cis-trans isomerase